MTRIVGLVLAGSVVLLSGRALSAAVPKPAKDSAAVDFVVGVYNHAEVHPETLAKAKREAAKVFRRIAVETRWVDCPCTKGDAALYPECEHLGRHGPAAVVLQLRPRRMAEALGFNSKTFGFAVPGRRVNEFAIWAYVFVHRVDELAYLNLPGLSKAVVLGHVMAHELGHLFLGPASNSSRGLMGFPWGKKQLLRAARGSLTFTVEQAVKIRQHVRERMVAGSSRMELAR